MDNFMFLLLPIYLAGLMFYMYHIHKAHNKEVDTLKSKLAFYEEAKFTSHELERLKKFLDFIEENQLKNEEKRSIGEAHLYYIRETLEIARKSSGTYSEAWWLCHNLQEKYDLKF